MKEILYEIIKEAYNGKIIISNDEWTVPFNTIIYNKNISYYKAENDITLIIKDENKTIKLLEEYVELMQNNSKIPKYLNRNDKIKYIITYLFINATTEDFLNIDNYIQRRINFIKNELFYSLNNGIEIPLGTNFNRSNLIISNEENSPSMETPNKIKIKLCSENDKCLSYDLPSVYYGIDNDICYIYAILNEKSNQEQGQINKKYIGQINRLLFKLNSDVKDLEEYNIHDEENIKDVSMSFILSLNIFISLLQNKGIKKVKIVPYLPLRYESRNIYAEESDNMDFLKKRNDDIQYNLTNKFIRTVRRLSYHNINLKIESLPYELDAFLNVTLNGRTTSLDNMLLEETNRKINNYKEGKKL